MSSPVFVLFDLDNVLVHKEQGPVRGVDRSVFAGERLGERTFVYLRPFLREFFDELLQGCQSRNIHVRLGVWSSMQPKNVQMIVALLNRMLAPVSFDVALDRTSCTPAPTPDNRYATKKLFSVFPPSVDTTCVLLVDNDADKMAGNPPEQCLVAPPFDVRAVLHESEIDRHSNFQRMWANVDQALMRQLARDVVDRALALRNKEKK